ncbi:hypothetical protein TDB9533_03961 [Thalassocella blandensis]|nr:hypothetical protein TDB9533_03961 [Thalassocella blandensis]
MNVILMMVLMMSYIQLPHKMNVADQYRRSQPPTFHQGFTLVEIAVVVLIMGFLLGSVLGPLTEQQKNQNIKKAETALEEIHDALLGYAALNGYLPCPATVASSGVESRVGGPGTDCTTEHGYVPSATLGLNGKFNANRLITDPWGEPLRYSLNDINTWEYAKQISVNSTAPTFDICESAACASGDILAARVAIVIYSLGPDRNAASTSADQAENLNNNDIFVSHFPVEATGSEFDDIVYWLSPNTLILHLVKAGQL